jgi:hypothetical protein
MKKAELTLGRFRTSLYFATLERPVLRKLAFLS